MCQNYTAVSFGDVAAIITAVCSFAAVFISVITLCYNAHQFKIAQIIERQQFLYDRRMEAYTAIFQILSCSKHYRSEIQNAIDHMDDLDFDPKRLFSCLCNNHYMQIVQRSVIISDREAEREYLSKANYFSTLLDSLYVLFDTKTGCMLVDIVDPYSAVINSLHACFVCTNTSESSGPVMHELDGKSNEERLRIVVEINGLKNQLERLLRQCDIHADMQKLFNVLVFIRNDLYAECKKLRFPKKKSMEKNGTGGF